MIKTITLKCAFCNKEIIKRKAEVDRRLKKGKNKFYCDNSCAGKHKVSHLVQYIDNFKKIKYIRKPDKYSRFRWYIKQIKKASNKHNNSYNIDLEYLDKIWKEQKGFCPFTKQKLILRTHYNYKNLKISPNMASLDRIDSTKGYIQGNVRFVCLMYNYAKNIFSDQEVINFCKLVVDND